jgi:hypothetical protein
MLDAGRSFPIWGLNASTLVLGYGDGEWEWELWEAWDE